MPLPLTKAKNSFVLNLNKEFYKGELIQKAVSEDEDWICEEPSDNKMYVRLKLNTVDKTDALEWINYLTYLHKEQI